MALLQETLRQVHGDRYMVETKYATPLSLLFTISLLIDTRCRHTRCNATNSDPHRAKKATEVCTYERIGEMPLLLVHARKEAVGEEEGALFLREGVGDVAAGMDSDAFFGQ